MVGAILIEWLLYGKSAQLAIQRHNRLIKHGIPSINAYTATLVLNVVQESLTVCSSSSDRLKCKKIKYESVLKMLEKKQILEEFHWCVMLHW